MGKRIIQPIALLALFGVSAGCGSSSVSDVTSKLETMFGKMAVTSPTATDSKSLASKKQNRYFAFLGSLAIAEDTTAPSDVKPFSEMVQDLKDKLGAGDPSALAAK